MPNPSGVRPQPAPSSARLHYAWIVLGITFVALAVGMGARSTWGVFVKPIEAEFGVNRTATSAVASVSLLLFAFSQPIIGWLLDRYGGRVVIGGSLLLMGAGSLLSGWVTEFWLLFIMFGIVGGIASGGAGLTSGSILAIRWFTERRGLAIGLASSGFSAGQLVFYPLITLLLTWYGWRQTYVVQGVFIILAVFPLVVWLLRNDPADVGLAPYGGYTEPTAAAARGGADPGRGVTMREAVRTLHVPYVRRGSTR